MNNVSKEIVKHRVRFSSVFFLVKTKLSNVIRLFYICFYLRIHLNLAQSVAVAVLLIPNALCFIFVRFFLTVLIR